MRVFTPLTDEPRHPFGLLVLTPLAVLVLPTLNSAVATSLGAILGIVIGMAAPFRGARWSLDVLCGSIGVLAAVGTAFAYLNQDLPGDVGLVLRGTLLLLLFACFVLGALLSGGERLTPAKGLTLFGFLEVATFVLSPLGLDLLDLPAKELTLCLLGACVVSALLGAGPAAATVAPVGFVVVVAQIVAPYAAPEAPAALDGDFQAAFAAVVSSVVVGCGCWWAMSRLAR